MNENIKRDYDKDPIVIEDYNTLFIFLFHISLIPVLIYIYIYNPGELSEDSLSRNIFIIIPMMLLPYIRPYFKSKGKRKIIVTEDNIKFLHENITIEQIQTSKITDIKKTYSDIYHKSQYPSEFGKVLFFVFIPILFYLIGLWALLFYTAFFLYLPLVKYFFYKFKDKEYKFYDSILIYSNDNFINILPTTDKEYIEIREYFITKKFGDIQNKKIYFEIGHLYENIDLEKGK